MEGTPFGRYRLVELLGRGGMGEVWRAYDPVIHRVVALKMLPATFADDKVFQERFRREARAAAGLDEPHVVPIYDFGEINGRLFVTMRFIKGRDLQELLDDGPLPPGRAVGIIEQVSSALHAAHEIGLVHRDVKPSNILVAKDDFAYLIDFGIARAAGETGLTSTGTTIGTWAYMAPERFREGTADASADIYALACVLHQSLTGKLPFPVHTFEQIAVAHLMEPPPKPSELRPEIPISFDDVIGTGMAKDPDQRYATTRELATAARAALTGPLPPVSEPDPPPPQPQTLYSKVAWPEGLTPIRQATPPIARPPGRKAAATPSACDVPKNPSAVPKPPESAIPQKANGAPKLKRATAPHWLQGDREGTKKLSDWLGKARSVFFVLLIAVPLLGLVGKIMEYASSWFTATSSTQTTSTATSSVGSYPASTVPPPPVTPTSRLPAGADITYIVTGTIAPGDIISVTYVDASGQRRTLNNVPIPWSINVIPSSSSDVGSVEASSLFRTSKLNCAVVAYNGTVLSSNNNDSPQTIC